MRHSITHTSLHTFASYWWSLWCIFGDRDQPGLLPLAGNTTRVLKKLEQSGEDWTQLCSAAFQHHEPVRARGSVPVRTWSTGEDLHLIIKIKAFWCFVLIVRRCSVPVTVSWNRKWRRTQMHYRYGMRHRIYSGNTRLIWEQTREDEWKQNITAAAGENKLNKGGPSKRLGRSYQG